MGIRTKNLHNIIIPLKVRTTLSATTMVDIAKVPFSGFISNIVAKALTPGSGATNSVLDVNLNGTTIFSSATKVTIASTTGAGTYGTLTDNPTSVTYGSMLSLDIDSCGINMAGVEVDVTISRGGHGALNTSEDQDEVL